MIALADTDIPGVFKDWSQFGVAVVALGWVFLRYMPKRDADAAAALKLVTDACASAAKEESATRAAALSAYTVALKEQRDDFRETASKLVDALREERQDKKPKE